jgi:hypothetical protein
MPAVAALDLDFDLGEISIWAARSAEFFERPAAELMRDNLRNLVAKIVRITPPHTAGSGNFSGGSRSVGSTEAKRHGEGKVEADIRRVYVAVPIVISDVKRHAPKSAKQFSYLVFNAKYAAAQDLLRRTGSTFANVPIDKFDGGLAHSRMRNRRGSVARTARPQLIVVDPRALDKYIKGRVGNVGLMASGWAPSLHALGGGVARWIGRHGDKQGSATLVAYPGEFRFIGVWKISWNNSAADLSRRVDAAIGYQVNAMVRALEGAMKKHGVTT